MLQHIEERIDNTKANVRQAAKEVKKVTICFFYQSNDCHWRRLIVCVCRQAEQGKRRARKWARRFAFGLLVVAGVIVAVVLLAL